MLNEERARRTIHIHLRAERSLERIIHDKTIALGMIEGVVEPGKIEHTCLRLVNLTQFSNLIEHKKLKSAENAKKVWCSRCT